MYMCAIHKSYIMCACLYATVETTTDQNTKNNDDDATKVKLGQFVTVGCDRQAYIYKYIYKYIHIHREQNTFMHTYINIH